MALSGDTLKAAMKSRLNASLNRVFASETGSNGTSAADRAKLADAISDIAMDIVTALTTEAQVLPGIPVITPVGPGSTAGPGKIQ